jgi:AraC-like DNA-binding protein
MKQSTGEVARPSTRVALMPVLDVLTLIRASGFADASIPELLDRMGLPRSLLTDTRGFVEPYRVWELCSTLGHVLDDEHLGLASRPVRSGTNELIVSRAMHSATLGEAMQALAQSANLVLPDVRVTVNQRLDEVHFGMTFPEPCSEARQIMLELTCIPYHATFCWLTDAQLPVTRVRTAGSRPSYATHFLALFNCPVEFGGSGTDIVYPREVCALPVTRRDLQQWRAEIYRAFLDELDRRRESFSGIGFASYVEQALRSGVTSQDAIAASACMAVATLRRKLHLERTSFREIRDRVLGELVRQHLDSGANVEEIAARVGYSDARSLRRAFRRVFGDSPAAFRARGLRTPP